MPSAAARVGVVLVNLGTPDAPDAPAVRRYLREFLGDPRVLDMPAVARRLLLELVILPFRPRRSAEAYRKVWTATGSPLLVHGLALRDAVARELGPGFEVQLGMRYGHPSLAAAIQASLATDVTALVIVPLYPHSASSSTGSTVEAAQRVLSGRRDALTVAVVPPFHADEGFLGVQAATIGAAIREARPDHVLFSFHGLPERHVLATAAERGGGACLTATCCARLDAANAWCYRAQCHATARELASRLRLEAAGWSLAFQSRFGRTPWIAPHADRQVVDLAMGGVRRLLVATPGFVADCLETLEELGMRGAASFRAAGGESLVLAPCLNAQPEWAAALANLVRRSVAGLTSGTNWPLSAQGHAPRLGKSGAAPLPGQYPSSP
jgi:ferrochelatase